MPEPEVAFAPTRVGGRRRRIPPGAVGLAIVAALGLALLKPWAGGPDRGSASPSRLASAIAVASATPSPVASAALASPAPAAVLTAPPPLGTWGVAFTAGVAPAPGVSVAWTDWTTLRPAPGGPAPSSSDSPAIATDCSGVPTVRVSPTIVALTVPPATPRDYGIRGWWSGDGFTRSLDGYLGRLDEPGRGPTAELARTDGWPWPDGRYVFHIVTGDTVTALGFCLAAPAPVSDPVGPAQAMDGAIVRDLAARSGAWGVGSGGDGPRMVRDEPWTDWAATDPGPAWNGSSLTLWPDTGLCMSVPILLDHPTYVAVTAPSGLAADWTVTAWWQDGTGIRSLVGTVRQIAPTGRGGVASLERLDRAEWPDGRYEFDVQAGQRKISLTACVGGG